MADLERAGIKAIVEGIDGYLRDLKRMSGATDDLGKDLEGAGKKTDGLGKGIASSALGFTAAELGMRALGGAFSFGLGNAVAFQKGLSAVGAISGATKTQMGELSKTALRIGADTSFSAKQAVGAMEELAANGVTTADIIGGAADAAAALAAAGGVDLPFAAATASTAMAAWGLKTSDLAEVVNRLAGAANTSRFGVEDMAGAIAQGAGAAATAGISFADFSTSIAATAASFSSGSDAGTSFKTFVLNLEPATDKAKATMEQLGIFTAEAGNAFFTSTGQAKPLAEIVQILHDKVGVLTAQEQVTALKNMFGADAFRTAAGLMKLTGDEFSTMSGKMRDTSAADVAKQRMDNLSGSFESLKGSLETVGINLGMKVIPFLTDITDKAIVAVNAWDKLPDSSQNIVLAFAGIAAAAPVAAGAVEKLTGLIKGLADGSAGIGTKLAGIGIAIGAITVLGDALLQKTTGHGLMEWLLGNPAHADRVSDALKRVDALLLALGPSGNPVVAVMERLKNASHDFAAQAEGMAQGMSNARDRAGALALVMGETGDYAKATEAAGKFSGLIVTTVPQIEAYGRKLMDLHAPSLTLVEAHNSLSGALQVAFDKTVNYSAILEGFMAPAEKAAQNTFALDDAFRALPGVIDPATQSTQAVGGAADAATREFLAMAKSLDPEGKNAAKAITEQLDILIGKFGELSPVVRTLTGENAFLNEELDDLKAKGKEISSDEAARIKILEGLIKANDEQIAGYQSNEKALKGAKAMLVSYIGEEGLGGLLTAMKNVPHEQQIEFLRRTSSAYQHLQSGDIPGAITAFGNLKEELGPEKWAPLAKAIGPELTAAIDKGVSDPAEREKIKASLGITVSGATDAAKTTAAEGGKGVGISMAEGLAIGLELGRLAAEAAAVGLARGVLAAAKAVIKPGSPSHVARDEIGIPISEGIAVGILEGAPEVFDAIVSVVSTALGLASGLTDMWSPIGTQDPGGGIGQGRGPKEDPFGGAAPLQMLGFNPEMSASRASAMPTARSGSFWSGTDISSTTPFAGYDFGRSGWGTGAPLMGHKLPYGTGVYFDPSGSGMFDFRGSSGTGTFVPGEDRGGKPVAADLLKDFGVDGPSAYVWVFDPKKGWTVGSTDPRDGAIHMVGGGGPAVGGTPVFPSSRGPDMPAWSGGPGHWSITDPSAPAAAPAISTAGGATRVSAGGLSLSFDFTGVTFGDKLSPDDVRGIFSELIDAAVDRIPFLAGSRA